MAYLGLVPSERSTGEQVRHWQRHQGWQPEAGAIRRVPRLVSNFLQPRPRLSLLPARIELGLGLVQRRHAVVGAQPRRLLGT